MWDDRLFVLVKFVAPNEAGGQMSEGPIRHEVSTFVHVDTPSGVCEVNKTRNHNRDQVTGPSHVFLAQIRVAQFKAIIWS